MPGEKVAKASLGHDPLPFLISNNKRTGAKIYAAISIFQIIFSEDPYLFYEALFIKDLYRYLF